MKKLMAVMAVGLLVGCEGPVGLNQDVRRKYPDADIAAIPGQPSKFIVRTKDGAVRFSESSPTGDWNTTHEVLIFGPIK